MIQLTNKQPESYENTKICHIFKKTFAYKQTNDKQ